MIGIGCTELKNVENTYLIAARCTSLDEMFKG